MGCCKNSRVSPTVSSLVRIREIRPGRFLAVHQIPADRAKPSTSSSPDEILPTVEAGVGLKGGISHHDSITSEIFWEKQGVFMGNGMSSATVVKQQLGASRTSSLAGDIQIYSQQPTKKSPNPSSKGVIFFFHGVGGSAWVWRHQMTYFASHGYEVIAIDLLGHGESPSPKKPSRYHFIELTRDALALFSEFSSPMKNIVVGHSYGTSLATVVAHDNPGKVQRLVLISGGSPTPLAPQPGLFTLPLCCLTCLHPCIRFGFERSAFFRNPGGTGGESGVIDSSNSLDPSGSQQGILPIDKDRSFDLSSYVLKSMMWGQIWEDGDEDYHAEIGAACLLIYGVRDTLVSLEEESEMLASLPNAWLRLIDNAGHMVMLERPDKVNQLMLDFIQAVEIDNQLPPPITNNTSDCVRTRPPVPLSTLTRIPMATPEAEDLGDNNHTSAEQQAVSPISVAKATRGKSATWHRPISAPRRSLPNNSTSSACDVKSVSGGMSSGSATSPVRTAVRRGVSSAGSHRGKVIPRLI